MPFPTPAVCLALIKKVKVRKNDLRDEQRTVDQGMKCCFCAPLRLGILIFGYINLVLSLLTMPMLIFFLVEEATGTRPVDPYISLSMFFLILDVISTIGMLVGTHRKHRRLLKIYFYFGAGLLAVTFAIDLFFFYWDIIEACIYVVFFAINIYLLFLVYKLVQILNVQDSEVQYVACGEQGLTSS